MRFNRVLRFFPLLLLIIAFNISCDAQEVEVISEIKEDQDLEELADEWIKKVHMEGKIKIKKVYRIGEGIDNRCQGWSGQGVAVRDHILYRLYDTGLCQTYDITDLRHPVKLGTFELKSHQLSNHANCAQSVVDENGDVLLYVSGIKEGKNYVERMTTTGSVFVQTIVLSRMEILNKALTFNVVCSDEGYLWLFGSTGDRLVFAKAKRPSLDRDYAVVTEDDILDVWFESGYSYSESVWQGGKVYGNLLFMLFGEYSNRHLALYDTRAHERIMDINLEGIVSEEPEDCELLPEGILIVTNGGDSFYLIQPD